MNILSIIIMIASVVWVMAVLGIAVLLIKDFIKEMRE